MSSGRSSHLTFQASQAMFSMCWMVEHLFSGSPALHLPAASTATRTSASCTPSMSQGSMDEAVVVFDGYQGTSTKDMTHRRRDRNTKLISVSRSKDRNFPAVHMEPQVLAYSEDLRILGMDISSDLSWGKYISGIAKSAAMRVGCLSRARKCIPPIALLYLYKTSIRPLIEYC